MAYLRIVSTGSVYKGKTGMCLYIFHRVTGVGLFGYLLLHIISTALILLGPEIYEGAEAIYKNFYFRVAEIGLMAAVLGHAINGLRIISVDLWSKGSDYVKYAEQMIDKDIRTNGEFYVCPVYNEAIGDDKKIKIFPIDKMWGLGTPEDLERYVNDFNIS